MNIARSKEVLEFTFTNDFDKEFIRELKNRIAPAYRTYNPDTRVWTIQKSAWPIFDKLCDEYNIKEDE